MKKEKKILLMLMAAVAGPAWAQETPPDSIKTQELKEVVVTATRSEKNPADVPRSVTVIGPDDLKNSVYSSVGELLASLEGIYVVGAGQNPGGLQSVFMRGSATNQVAVMVDGMPVTDPSTVNRSVDFSELPLSNVERIEIVRGSHSTLYGPSAIGGAINIITKKNSDKLIGADITYNGGVFGRETASHIANVGLQYNHKKGVYVNTGVFLESIKGLDATVDTVTNPTLFNDRDQDGFDKSDFYVKGGFKNDRLDIFAGYRVLGQLADIDDGAFNDDDNYTLSFGRKTVNYGASGKVNEKFRLGINGGYSDMYRQSINDSSVIDAKGNYDHSYFEGNYYGTISNHELQGNVEFAKGVEMIFGGGFYRETMTYNTWYLNSAWMYESRSDLDTLDLYSQTSAVFAKITVEGWKAGSILKNFGLSIGTRMGSNSAFGNYNANEINLYMKLPENGMLYGSFSTGFNPPSLYQLYSPEKELSSGITRGNENLEPEQSLSMEAGFKQKINSKGFISVALFRTIVENSIDYVYLWDKNTPVSSVTYADYRGDAYLNIGVQEINGVELSFSTRLAEQLTITGNISLVNGRLKYNPADVDSAKTQGHHVQLYSSGAFLTGNTEFFGLARRPGTANAAIHYSPVKELTFSASLRYAGMRSDNYYDAMLGPYGALASQTIGDYVIGDIMIRGELAKNIIALLKFENVTNKKYYEISGYTTRGRGIYAGIRYQY